VLGDTFVAEGYRFEVIDLDGLRIDKVLVSQQ
jgi:CBS domain containing-hemolysin-like protein